MTLEVISGCSALRALIECIDEACWALDDTGRVRLANSAALDFESAPAWATRIARGERFDPPSGFRVRQVPVDADMWTLIFELVRAAGISPTAHLFGLDANDAEILDHVVRGFSDREIVLVTGRPIATVHTAIVRIFRDLGVTDRAELVALLSRTRRGRDGIPTPSVDERRKK